MMADERVTTTTSLKATTADVLETVERVAKPKSKQPQYAANAESFYGAVMRWVKSAQALEQPDYATDSRRRDAWMLDFWRLEPHLAGVLNSVLTINANRGWTLTGGRNQVYRYTSVLHDQTWAGPSLNGWRPYFTVQSLSYYATDMGVISEVGRQGRRGPLRALYHTDPSRCKLTGNTKAPLSYYPRSGKRQLWTPDDYFRICSMPAAQEKYLNLGFSAVSRCVELAKMMIGILEHDQEMIGARMPKGLLLLQGISEAQWEEALKAREAKQDSLERLYFGGVMTLATAGLEQLDARLVALSQLPAGFDKKEFMDLLMYGYALCFGYDPSEFWPVQYGAMGRGTEVETQHRKATGKGGLEFVLAYQENLQRLLPDTLQFDFEQRDEEGQLLTAQVAQAWADVA
ncbi:MAG: hypothetical protein H8D78_05565, partial [Chloroflexi bacterium]|nr:hypothetical protein [Chloroflexota bacterium]